MKDLVRRDLFKSWGIICAIRACKGVYKIDPEKHPEEAKEATD